MWPTSRPGDAAGAGADARDRAPAAVEQQVGEALKHLHDLAYLQTHPLASRALSDRSGRAGGAGKALQQSLLEAIGALGPARDAGNARDPRPAAAGSRAGRGYRLLTLRFVEGLALPAVLQRLAVSRSEYYRDYHRAVAAVASFLQRRWGEPPPPAPGAGLWVLHGGQRSAVPERGWRAPASLASPARAGRLPEPAASFVGREQELAEVGRLLGATRLLTLTGAGGSGKTRLALRAAAGQRGRFPDGVRVVELAALAEPLLVPAAVAAALGVPETRGEPPLEPLLRALDARRLLLVLDNCEHLLDACAQLVEAVLRACPDVRVLATSREALGLPGEVRWRVPPLAAPPEAGAATVERLGAYDAVRLFVDRAAAALPGFALTGENAPAVACICARLDGLPLALELAAARVAELSVEQLAARLDDHLRLLTVGNRAALPRQRTLRATVDWSYALLAPAERALFRRLAVFAGGWTPEAAEQVCAGAGGDGIEPGEVLALLLGLVGKSLVVAEGRGSAEDRYRLLETLRAYARERLGEAGGAPALRARHAAYYLALAERAAPGTPAGDVAALDQLEREHANLREALRWWAGRGEAEAGLRAATALSWFWGMRAHRTERREWLARFLALPEAAAPAVRARALVMAGDNAVSEGDAAAGRTLLEEGLRIAREAEDLPFVCRALEYLGHWAAMQGDLGAAEAYHRECLAFSWPAGGQGRFGQGLHVVMPLKELGQVAALRGDAVAARAHLEDALAVARESGRPRAIAGALEQVGDVACEHGDYEAARAHCEESLAIFRAVGDKPGVANVLAILGDVARAFGDPDRAGAFYVEAMATAREGRFARAVAQALGGLGALAHDRRDDCEARARLEESLAISRTQGAAPQVAQTLADLGGVERAQGSLEAAEALHRESLTIRRDLGLRPGVAHALEGLAGLAATRGQPERALRLAGAADALREATGARRPPVERVVLQEDVLQARRALGEAAAEAAWAAGRALPLDRAAAEALQGPADRPAPPPAASRGRPEAASPDGHTASVPPLTRREAEVAALVARGRTNRQIARELIITVGTADRHVANILGKLGATSRAQIAVWAAEHGLVPRAAQDAG
jgi:predicted ATPase/DNA-binding NarL/FixJ family response regulator